MPRVPANAVEEAAARGDQAFFRQLEAIVEDSARHISASMFSADGGSRNLDEMTREILAEVPVSLHKRIAIAVYNALVVAIDHVPMKEAMSWAFRIAGDAMVASGSVRFSDRSFLTATRAMIMLGVMRILTPCVFRLLGFGPAGPVEGSWATGWQMNYGGAVDVQNLCAYLEGL